MTGAIPNTINNLTNLEEVNLSINQLISTIPSNLDSLVNLKYLNLSSNELFGSIPGSLGYLNNLLELYLFRNNLSEIIPETVCNLIENECQISVYDNQLCPPYFECLGDVVGVQDTSNCDQRWKSKEDILYENINFIDHLLFDKEENNINSQMARQILYKKDKIN